MRCFRPMRGDAIVVVAEGEKCLVARVVGAVIPGGLGKNLRDHAVEKNAGVHVVELLSGFGGREVLCNAVEQHGIVNVGRSIGVVFRGFEYVLKCL